VKKTWKSVLGLLPHSSNRKGRERHSTNEKSEGGGEQQKEEERTLKRKACFRHKKWVMGKMRDEVKLQKSRSK